MAPLNRFQRMVKWWQSMPHRMLKKYPEQTLVVAFFVVPASIVAVYKFGYIIPQRGQKPYYLNRYAAVRPDDEIAKNWRDAKDYPAYYLPDSMEFALPHLDPPSK
ncbi:hypothetical protein WR25_22938 [Diploscapter pachys]|uniref:Uncharacterized protein n=1 Tax=Diploscapter pachys TaxID=2018661 RepID=A0A2A2L5X8_9BILA|nr:hypothetical protein WR25_22938 [Diploscapter pachys]